MILIFRYIPTLCHFQNSKLIFSTGVYKNDHENWNRNNSFVYYLLYYQRNFTTAKLHRSLKMFNLKPIDLQHYQEYINKFEKISELAKRFDVSPGRIVEMFFKIGLEALSQTESILQSEFESKLKEFFPEINLSEARKKLKIILENPTEKPTDKT